MSTALRRKTMGGDKKFCYGGVRLAAAVQIGFCQDWRKVPFFSQAGILSLFLLTFGRNQSSSHRMNFKRILPHPALRKYIRGYWHIETGPVAEHLSLVPDGYPELFFSLGSQVEAGLVGQKPAALPKAGFMGQLTGLFMVHNAPGSQVLYVKMYPWTPNLLFRTPLWQLNDQFPELEALTHDPSFRRLALDVQACGSLADASVLLDAFLLKKLLNLTDENPFLRHAVHQIFDRSGAMNVDCLTGHIHASRRYVEKLFKNAIGISPKRYARLIRVKKASICMLDKNFSGNIGHIASGLDYYDQSHFLKDFKSVTGQSPTAFLRSQGLPFDRVEDYLGQWDYSK
jgi:AraC-like DNA-binding protein